MDTQIQTLTRRIQTAQGLAEKSRITAEMGNVRYDRYKMTGDPQERKLAANCYLASRNFFYRNTQTSTQQALGTGIKY